MQPRRTKLLLICAALTTFTGCDMLGARFKAREGVDLYKAQDYGGAASKFDEASRMDPTLPVLRLNAGTSNLAHFRNVGGKSKEGQEAATRAIQAYEKYLELKPQDERVKAALVQTFIETGRYEDAVVFFRPAVEKNDVEALGVLATIAAKCSKKDEAESWHKKKIAATPNKPDGYLSLGVFLWNELHDNPTWPHDKRKEKAATALEALKKAIDLAPAAPNAYTYTNLVYREIAATEPTEEGKRKNLEEATRYFKMALERQNQKAG